jgi:hypothetical protein
MQPNKLFLLSVVQESVDILEEIHSGPLTNMGKADIQGSYIEHS